MKGKILNLLLVITSFIGYLEWAGNHHIFLFQGEIEILSKLFNDTASVVHPFTLLPLLGQVLLLSTLFQKQPGKLLTYSGIGCIGILLLFMFLIGLISLNYKILFSTIPFLVTAFFTIKHHRRKQQDLSQK